jgi:hypothetical protein
MDTRPPIFKEAAESLDAEEWINTIEDRFHVLRMTEVLKTKYAAHQLQGPAGMWWKHHRTASPPPMPTLHGGNSLRLFVEFTFHLV